MKVFISYKREDQSFAENLRTNLISWGHSVWMDVYDIPKGVYWPDEIDKALRNSDAVIGIMSPGSIESRNVKNEWDWAIVNNTQLVLMMYKKCYVPMNYVSINYINCDENVDASLSELRDALESSGSLHYSGVDPYRDYLQTLYNRINTYLGQKIIFNLRDEQGVPSPLKLGSTSDPNAVDGLFSKQVEVDPLFEIGGVNATQTEQDFNSPNQAFDYYGGRILLLGEPGAGKTITLLHFGRDAIVQRLQNPNLPLPILGIVPTWNAAKYESIADWLDSSISAPKQVEQLLQSGNALLLLDGLDELGGERPISPQDPYGETFDPREEFLNLLPPNNQIILTSRVKDYEQLGTKANLNGAIRLQKLTRSQIHVFLHDFPELQNAVDQDSRLFDIASVPMLLSFFAYAFSNDSLFLDNTADLTLEQIRDRIFGAYLRKRYEHESRKPNANLRYKYDKIITVLSAVAELDAIGETENYVKRLYIHHILGYEPDYFIEEMTKLNIFLPTDDPDVFRFIHLSLRDFLAFPELLRTLNKPTTEWRLKVIQVLGNIGDQRATEGLIQHLENPDANIRSATAYALGQIADPQAIEPLIEALNDDKARVRSAAATALSQIGDPRAIIPIAKLAYDGDRQIQQVAVTALKQFNNATSGEPLAVLLGHERPIVQEAAMTTLLEIGSTAEHHLIKALSTNDPIHRSNAVRVLGKLRSTAAVPYLTPLLHDTASISFVEHVNDVVAEALKQIGSEEAENAVNIWLRENQE